MSSQFIHAAAIIVPVFNSSLSLCFGVFPQCLQALHDFLYVRVGCHVCNKCSLQLPRISLLVPAALILPLRFSLYCELCFR